MPNPNDLGSHAWSEEQLHNAQVIINVGLRLNASQRDIRIALMTALVESGLRNVHYGDADSLGLFQQRAAWGTEAQRMDPQKSARMFFEGGHGGQRGLFDFADRDQMGLGEAAQAVQVSAFPERYREQHDEALGLIQQLGLGEDGGGPKGHTAIGGNQPTEFQPLTKTTAPTPIIDQFTPVSQEVGSATDLATPVAQTVLGLGPVQPVETSSVLAFSPTFQTPQDFQKAAGGKTTGGWRHDLVQYAKQFIGTPYVWGGTTPDGFDCSGFTQYVYKKFGIDLPRISADQGRDGRRISIQDAKPGDLIFWNNSSRNQGADHVAIVLAGGRIIEAPRPGLSVQISNLYDLDEAFAIRVKPGNRG